MLKLGLCCVPRSLMVGFRLVETTVNAEQASEGWAGASTKTVKVPVVLIQILVWNTKDSAAGSARQIGPQDDAIKCTALLCTTETTVDAALAWMKPHVELLKLTRFGPLFLPRSMVTWGYMEEGKTTPIGSSSGFIVDTAQTYYVCHLATTHGWLRMGRYSDAQEALDAWQMAEREICATHDAAAPTEDKPRFPSGR